MILIDFRGLCLNEVFGYANFLKTGNFDEKVFVQSVLITLGEINKKFRSQYGELVVCNDCRKSDYWRKEIFPNYKVNRDGTDIYERYFRDPIIRDRMRKMPTGIARIAADNFPFKVLTIPRAEADDIIGTLVYANSKQKHVIVSKDQDFFQLQRFDVDQYAWSRKDGGWKKSENPTEELKNKILKGDRGDGIPNVLSPLNALAEGIPQTRLNMKPRLELLESDPHTYDDDLKDRFEMNEKLIDLSKTPVDICEDILRTYRDYEAPKFKSLMKNMMSLGFKNVMNDLNLFKIVENQYDHI